MSSSYESCDLVTIAFLLSSYKVKIKLVAHKLFYKHPKKRFMYNKHYSNLIMDLSHYFSLVLIFFFFLRIIIIKA